MIIEEVLIKFLQDQNIDTVGTNVYAMTPKQPLEGNYIVIDKTGGANQNRISRATIAVQSISSESLYEAAQINEAVIDAMGDFPGSVTNVFGCHLQADYNFTNTTTKQYRYQAVYDITYKRQEE